MSIQNLALGITQGSKMVAAPGTRVPLSSTDVFTKSVFIQAKRLTEDNTGKIYIGDENLAYGSNEGPAFTPGADLTISSSDGEGVNLKLIYVDAATATDGVVFLYIPMPS